MKAMLRKPARFVYRLLKPIIRPIAFRVRGFLVTDLRAEVGALRRELGDVRREAFERHCQSGQAIKSFREEALGLLRATLETQRELLESARNTRQQIFDFAQEAQQKNCEQAEHSQRYLRDEMEGFSAGLIQELQASRDFLESDISRLSARLVREQHAVVAAPSTSRQPDRTEEEVAAMTTRVAVNCGSDDVLVRTEVGYLLCHGGDHRLLSVLLESADVQRGAFLLIERLVRPGDVFVDVDAGVGLYTLAAARALQGRGRIVAFESIDERAHRLEKAVVLNGFSGIVEIHRAASSTSKGSDGTGVHKPCPAPCDANASGSAGFERPPASIDGLIEPNRSVALIRIGDPTAALEVLGAAAAIIRDNPDIAIVAEFVPQHICHSGLDSGEWLAAFGSHGLVCRVVNSETGALEEWTIEQLEHVGSVNVLFTRADSPALSK